MWYPPEMTREDIESFERDMAEYMIHQEELDANWILQEVSEDDREYL